MGAAQIITNHNSVAGFPASYWENGKRRDVSRCLASKRLLKRQAARRSRYEGRKLMDSPQHRYKGWSD